MSHQLDFISAQNVVKYGESTNKRMRKSYFIEFSFYVGPVAQPGRSAGLLASKGDSRRSRVQIPAGPHILSLGIY